MKIAIASDHAGYEMKEIIKRYLIEKENEVEDFGTDSIDSVDYPDYARPAAESISKGRNERGIIICGSGQGMTMVANKVPGIRAALCNDLFSAEMSRRHNDSNVLTMGARIIGEDLAKLIVDIWLRTEFEGGKHKRRVSKIESP